MTHRVPVIQTRLNALVSRHERNLMQYYLAPLEGITTYTFRRCYEQVYGGIDRYFTPFLASKKLSKKERNEVLPEHNEGVTLIPQILSNVPETFLSIAEQLQALGYDTVNLNLGCPAGTVVSRHRGSGQLYDTDELERFLDLIFEKCPLNISIKTRIGIAAVSEWEDILKVYAKYPLEELIIHPRLTHQGYGGTPHLEAYKAAVEALDVPLCYNGDIISKETENALLAEFPQTERIMLGRGVLRDPGLIPALQGQEFTPSEKAAKLRAFHDALLEGYRQIMPGETEVLFKMKDIWAFLGASYEGCDRELKEIRKASSVATYRNAVRVLLG